MTRTINHLLTAGDTASPGLLWSRWFIVSTVISGLLKPGVMRCQSDSVNWSCCHALPFRWLIIFLVQPALCCSQCERASTTTAREREDWCGVQHHCRLYVPLHLHHRYTHSLYRTPDYRTFCLVKKGFTLVKFHKTCLQAGQTRNIHI